MSILHPQEQARLRVLHALALLDTAPEPEFDTAVAIAKQLLDCKTAFLSLVDADRQWFKATSGSDVCETGRDISFCTHAVAADAPLVVPDTLADARFADNPLVTGSPHIRFYAGVPLRARARVDGPLLPVGTLCVTDDRPHRATDQFDLLVKLACVVEALFESRRASREGLRLALDRHDALVVNHDYVYPNAAELDYYAAAGARVVRIPFRWERLQPALYGPLATVDRAALQSVVRNARARGLVVVLDMHDYARRRPHGQAKANATVGTVDLGASALTDAWTKIAADYRDDPNVWLGLMNEPSGIAVADWWRVAQQLVVDLRGQRVTNKLLVPGGSWTGAHSWFSSGNAAQAARFTDPGRNYAFELHQYLDKDSSGTQATCTAGSAKRVDAALSWAEQASVPLFFGEIAAGASAICQAEYDAMLQKLNASPAVIGWTAWGGGRWWNTSYMFRLAPVSGGAATPHMQMIQKRFR